MGPLGAGLISAGGDIAGSAVQGLMAQKTARDQMQFQDQMSSTAHQREVADLRKAGLNPILSANSGASTPTGGQAAIPDLSSIGTKAVSSAQQYGRLNLEKEKTTQDIRTSAAVEKLNNEQAKLTNYNARTVELENSRREVMSNIWRKILSGSKATLNWLNETEPVQDLKDVYERSNPPWAEKNRKSINLDIPGLKSK